MDISEPKEPQELQEPEKPQEILEPPEPPESEQLPETKEPEKVLEDKKVLESMELEESEDITEPIEYQEPQKRKKLFEVLRTRESEDFAEYQEFEDVLEPKEPVGVWKRTGRSESPQPQESQEPEEYEKPDKLRELIEAPAGPLEDEQFESVLSSKPLPRKSRRIKRTKSTLVCFLLTVWSLLCLFLLFYVPGRYEQLLRNSAFGKRFQVGGFADDCLILSLMALWFLGALMLFVITTGRQKDRYPVRRSSY